MRMSDDVAQKLGAFAEMFLPSDPLTAWTAGFYAAHLMTFEERTQLLEGVAPADILEKAKARREETA